VTASITTKALTATVAAPNKVYDGNTTAAPTLSITGGLVGTETVTATGSASFNSKDVLTAHLVTVNSGALANGVNGGLASNYSLSAGQTVVASITSAALAIGGITAANKVYDGNSSAAVNTASATKTGLVAGDLVTVAATGLFNNKNVANAKTVTLASSYSGADLGNYSTTDQASTTANITPKALTIGGLTAASKVYDGNSSAAVNTASATQTGLVAGDLVTVAATGLFNDKHVANAKTVTLASSYTHRHRLSRHDQGLRRQQCRDHWRRRAGRRARFGPRHLEPSRHLQLGQRRLGCRDVHGRQRQRQQRRHKLFADSTDADRLDHATPIDSHGRSAQQGL
jgi:hypothetical protein